MKRAIDSVKEAGYMLCIAVAALIALCLMLAHAAWEMRFSKWPGAGFLRDERESDLPVGRGHAGNITSELGH